MKIAHIVCQFPPYQSGMGSVAFEEAKELSQNNEVTVFTLSQGTTSTFLNRFKIVWLRPWLRFGNGGFCPSLLWHLQDFDIIQLHYPFFGVQEIIWLAKFFKILKKPKLIIYYHMDAALRNIPLKIFSLPAALINRGLFSLADHIICSTLDYVQHSKIKEIYQKYQSKFIEIPFGAKELIQHQQEKESVKGEKVVLFVGNLDQAHYFKGVDILIMAFKKVLNRLPAARLIIVGDGNLRQKYENLAKKINIQRRITFAGRVADDELASYYQKADLSVVPSINSSEAFSLVLIEAKSFAKAVIASDLPGVRQIAVDNASGLLARPGDIADLAQKIEEILINDNLRQTLGERGRQVIQEKYNWPHHMKELATVYNSVLTRY